MGTPVACFGQERLAREELAKSMKSTVPVTAEMTARIATVTVVVALASVMANSPRMICTIPGASVRHPLRFTISPPSGPNSFMPHLQQSRR